MTIAEGLCLAIQIHHEIGNVSSHFWDFSAIITKMFNSVLKKLFGVLMIILGIIFLFVPVIPSSPFFILGAIALGFVTKDYIKRKLSLKMDDQIYNKGKKC